jgi:hypothetical protein
MQRKVCVAMIESMALTPWLKGKKRFARAWGRAPELISGVPLQSGQYAARRLKNAISQVTTLNTIPPRMKFLASGLGSRKNNTSAVTVVISPKKCSEEKSTATLNGRLYGSERACKNLALAGGKWRLAGDSRPFMVIR